MKWQYRIVGLDLTHPEEAQDLLNEDGQEGWEVQCLLPNSDDQSIMTIFLLKRQTD